MWAVDVLREETNYGTNVSPARAHLLNGPEIRTRTPTCCLVAVDEGVDLSSLPYGLGYPIGSLTRSRY